jgi:hypothetical protein
MVARIARFRQQPERFTKGGYRWVLDAIRESDGFVDAYHVVDPSTGDSISISIFDREDSARPQRLRSAKRGAGSASRHPRRMRSTSGWSWIALSPSNQSRHRPGISISHQASRLYCWRTAFADAGRP